MRTVTKKIVCSLLVAASISTAATVTAASTSPSFTDIDQSYAKDAINRLVQYGILHGVDDTHFNPRGELTRAEFTAILVRALRLPIDSTNTLSSEFSDVSGWAAPYITSARNAGIVNGISTDRFNPNGLLTREQAAKLLFSALALLSPDVVIDKNADPSFLDAEFISDWAKPYVAMAADLGLVSGRPDGTFAPKSIANREMAAIMAGKLLDSQDYERIILFPPTNFHMSDFNGTSITFAWDEPPNANGVTGYDIFMNSDQNKIGSTTDTSFTINDLDPKLNRAVFYVKSKDVQGRLSDKTNEYLFSTASRTTLTINPNNWSFTHGQEKQAELSIGGSITREDWQQRARIYMSIDNVTSRDITFGSIQGLGAPEVIQEGSGSQPLIVAWGDPQGFELSNYLALPSYLHIPVSIPITINKRGVRSTLIELRTAGTGITPVSLASFKALMTGDLAPIESPTIEPEISGNVIQVTVQ